MNGVEGLITGVAVFTKDDAIMHWELQCYGGS